MESSPAVNWIAKGDDVRNLVPGPSFRRK